MMSQLEFNDANGDGSDVLAIANPAQVCHSSNFRFFFLSISYKVFSTNEFINWLFFIVPLRARRVRQGLAVFLDKSRKGFGSFLLINSFQLFFTSFVRVSRFFIDKTFGFLLLFSTKNFEGFFYSQLSPPLLSSAIPIYTLIGACVLEGR